MREIVQGLREELAQDRQDIRQELSRVSRNQAEAVRPQLTKPFLAAIYNLSPSFGLAGDVVDQLRRCLRIVDVLPDPDEILGPVLEGLWQQSVVHPHFSDSQLLREAVTYLPVGRASGQGLSAASLLQPSAVQTSLLQPSSLQPSLLQSSLLQPSGGHGLAGAVGLGGLGGTSLTAATGGLAGASRVPGQPQPCYRCGRRDHDRAQSCTATTFSDGGPIPLGQKARFAPAAWKARYGFDSRGYAKAQQATE